MVDAMTGQEAATLASVFNEKIGITGAVLTKMDGDSRGGAALSVQVLFCAVLSFIGNTSPKAKTVEIVMPLSLQPQKLSILLWRKMPTL